jgi:hypothetical protein
MLMVLKRWRRVFEFVLLKLALFEQIVEWLVFQEQRVRGIHSQPLPVLVSSPLSRSRGARRTRLSVEVSSTRPARGLPSATRPFLTVPFSE